MARLGLGAALWIVSPASGAILFNEVFINPPSTDNGQEFVELISSTGGVESLAGLTLVIIEGDGASSGVVDQAIALSGSTGSNGLWLQRDSVASIDTSAANAGVQGPDPATTVVVSDFLPDIENGSNTYLLVTGYDGTGITLGMTDLDPEGDGMLNITPWTSVVDGISLIENDGDTANGVYASQFSGTTFGPTMGFNADLIVRLTSGGWLIGDVTGTNPGGAYSVDPTRFEFVGTSGILANVTPEAVATPGVANPTLVPEPTSLMFCLVGGMLLLGHTRRLGANG